MKNPLITLVTDGFHPLGVLGVLGFLLFKCRNRAQTLLDVDVGEHNQTINKN